jgi:hypothetical protein
MNSLAGWSRNGVPQCHRNCARSAIRKLPHCVRHYLPLAVAKKSTNPHTPPRSHGRQKWKFVLRLQRTTALGNIIAMAIDRNFIPVPLTFCSSCAFHLSPRYAGSGIPRFPNSHQHDGTRGALIDRSSNDFGWRANHEVWRMIIIMQTSEVGQVRVMKCGGTCGGLCHLITHDG